MGVHIPYDYVNAVGNINNNQAGNRNGGRFERPVRAFDVLPYSQATVFRLLIEKGVSKPLEGWKPKMEPLPPNWDHGKFCENHNISGPDTKNCYNLKNHLQDLIEKGVLERGVRPVNRAPNVVNNTLPGNQVNMLRQDNDDHEKDKTFITITDKSPQLPVYVTPASLDCNMNTWESLLGKKKEVNLVADNAEVNHLTISGKVYQPPVPGEVSKKNPLPQAVSEDKAPEDPVLTQMKSTNANISIWGLLCVSKKNRDALSKSLAQAVFEIDTSPYALTQMIGNIHFGNVIVFSELDIPKAGTEHTEALNITVDYGSVRNPKVLIDNGSSVNVCPSKTLAKLEIGPIDLAPCAQTIRAYNNTSRNVLGIVSLPLTLGTVIMKVDIYVMDIAATFNLLLGRPWIHEVKGVPSTLHQMFKFPHGNCIVTVMAEKCIGKDKEGDVPLL